MTVWIWDADKAASNLVKHGIAFDVAARALNDPLAATRIDVHPDGDRLQTIARAAPEGELLLFVVHTEAVVVEEECCHEEPTGRIISARKATRNERRRFEKTVW